MTVRSITFPSLPIWVQIWGLPFDLINEEVGLEIGKSLGKVVEVDCKAFASDQARLLCVRVEIPLDKPVRRGGPVVNPEGDQTLVAFKHERLCGLCFRCGRIGHESKECSLPSLEGEELPYGEWMKAGFKRSGVESRRTPDGNMGRQETAPESGGNRALPQANPSRNDDDVGDIFGKDGEEDGDMAITRYVEENHTIHANQQPNITPAGPDSSTRTTEPNMEDVIEGRSGIGSLNNGIHLFSVPITFGSQNTILHGNGDGSHSALDMGPRDEGRTQVKERKAKVGQSSKSETQVRPIRSPMQVELVAPSSGKKQRLHENYDGSENGGREDSSKHPRLEGLFTTTSALTVEDGHWPRQA